MAERQFIGGLIVKLNETIKQDAIDRFKNKPKKTIVTKPKLLALCPRLKNRTHVLGDTVFIFDSDGISRSDNVGHTYYDFIELLKLNGVTELKEDPALIHKKEAMKQEKAEIKARVVADLSALIMNEDVVVLPNKLSEADEKTIKLAKKLNVKPMKIKSKK